LKKFRSICIFFLCFATVTITNFAITEDQTTLHEMIYAAEAPDSIRKFIEEYCVDVNYLGWYEDFDGNFFDNAVSPLHLAAEKLDFELIHVLLLAGARIKIIGFKGLYPLYFVLKSIHFAFVADEYIENNFREIEFCDLCFDMAFNLLSVEAVEGCFLCDFFGQNPIDFLNDDSIPLYLRVAIKEEMCGKLSFQMSLSEEQEIAVKIL